MLRPLIDRLFMLLPTRRFPVSRVDDTGQQLQITGKVAALERDIVDLLTVDQARARAVAGLHERGLRLHRDLLAQLTDFQTDGAERKALSRAKLQPLLLVRLEALDRHFDVVISGQQVGKQEGAVGAGGHVAREVGAGVLDRHGCTGHDAATRIGDDARDLCRESLSP